MKKLRLVLITVLLAFALGTSAYAAMFSNGSFELGTANPGSNFIGLSTGNTGIDSWNIISGAIDYIGGYWIASDGARSIDLNASLPGAISQTFDTIAGRPYSVLFDFAGNPAGSPSNKIMRVSVNGLSHDFEFDVTGNSLSSMGWITESLDFTASTTETTLTFSSLINGAYGPAIDNVRVNVNAVPVPAAVWLFGSGLLSLLGFRRRFNK